MARTGRRQGSPDTREAILDAARDAFAERVSTVRRSAAIATGAGVDPALVHHYFGTKEQLFLATVGAPIDPGEIIPSVARRRPRRDRRTARPDVPVRSGATRCTGPALLALVRSGAAARLVGPDAARVPDVADPAPGHRAADVHAGRGADPRRRWSRPR